MNTIARLIELALLDLFLGTMPESYIGECEIELNRYWVGQPYDGFESGDYYVVMGGKVMIIDAEDLDGVWHCEDLEVAG